MVKINDISIFFRSSCCSNSAVVPPPCRNSARVTGHPHPIDIFKYLPKGALTAVTITIGNKYYGSMSSDEQYKRMKKCISIFRWRLNLLDEDSYFYFTFELQSNGQLHAHGILYNIYHTLFVECFGQFGRRNLHKDSFQPVFDVDKYIAYIQKEEVYKRITNIQKKHIQSIIKNESKNRCGDCEKLSEAKSSKPSTEIRTADLVLPSSRK